MGQPVEIKSPLKGVLKNPNYQDHPADAALDALNVLPWDRFGRQRVNQRPGLDKLYSSAMGTGTQRVQSMTQTTIALDPSTIVANTQLLNEQWVYSNGSFNTAAAANWQMRDGSGTIGSGFTTITSNQAVVAGLFSATQTARYIQSLALGTAYVVKFVFQIDTNTSANINASVVCRMDSSGANGIALELNGSTTLRIRAQGGAAVTTVTLPAAYTTGVFHTLELHVNGNAFAGFLDGIQYVTGSSATGAGNSFMGWSVSTGTTAVNLTSSQFQVFTGANLANFRQSNLVSVTGGSVYIGTIGGTNTLTSNGSGILSTTNPVSAVSGQGNVYFTDGLSVVQKLIIATQVSSTFVATAGSLPTLCTLAALYRDRLVLAAPTTTPQNFFFSRVGTHSDFDYSQKDTAAAFAGNASTAGHIGDPIVALMPFSDDVMFIGGDHDIWAVRGDPADGGSIDLVSDAIGVLGMNAWTKAPDGTLYFAGTGGLYKIPPGTSAPVNISNANWNEFFRQINRANQYVTLIWDRDRQGMYVFVTPVNQGAALHVWYDQRTGGLWPIQYPAGFGPTAAVVYDGDGPTDRVTLIGGFDGYIRRQADTNKADDGTAISSYVYIGPYKTSETSENLLEWMDIILGEPPTGFTNSDWSAQVNVYGAQTVENALNQTGNTSVRQKIYTLPRRQIRWLARQRGSVFLFKISNSVLNKTWSLEKIVALVTPAGTVRRR